MIDLDCEVRHDLKPLFEIARNGCALREDRFDYDAANAGRFQSGVIAVRHGHALIPEYAAYCLQHWQSLHSDQSGLNAVIGTLRDRVDVMAPEFHWLRLEGDNPQALIMHWTGVEGKALIRRVINSGSKEEFDVVCSF